MARYRWTRQQKLVSISGVADTEVEAMNDAINAAPNALNASAKVFNASSGILVQSKQFRLVKVGEWHQKGWFPSDK